MKFLIYTLGCKVNTYESEVMKELLLKNGYIYDEEQPDIVIINTCTVTNMADNKSKKMVRHFKKTYPNAFLVVCGCSSQNDKSVYEDIGVDILLGNEKKSEIVKLLNERKQLNYVNENRKKTFENMQVDAFKTHTRAFVKIQDGCDNFCSYCVIPIVRGSIRNKEFSCVLKEVQTLVDNNHQEIVLTGIHTGSYGTNTKYDLTDLIHEISKIENLKRIRISSIEITELNDKFLNELKNNPKICDHLHIPLQAGSDEILKVMRRKYNLEEYKHILDKIRSIRPNISITTDVIVGHPYETEELFEKTMKTVKEFSFAKVHVFPYSKRNLTLAANMPNQVEESIKKQRSKMLVKLSNELEEEYAKKFINKTLEVLVEKDGIGLTSNYLKVKIEDDVKQNTFVKVNIKKIDHSILYGTVISNVKQA